MLILLDVLLWKKLMSMDLVKVKLFGIGDLLENRLVFM